MTHSYANDRAMSAGQYAHDNAAEPYDDSVAECHECAGKGEVNEENPEQRPDGCDVWMVPCQCCDGAGWLDEEGNPAP